MSKQQPVLTLDSLRGEGRESGTCKVVRLVRTLSPENQEVINDALSGPEFEFPSAKIETALRSLGLSISDDPIIKHRRGLCTCTDPLEVIE
jgi:hypothetical protein